MTNSNSKLTLTPLPQDNPKQRQPDIVLANKELNRDELKSCVYK